ncbi:Sodium-dependent phosphate transport protein 2B-like protein [Aphelenchoides fujianensis]|nr:Sodium-dependent phosphate transport protein 2B-like protein [Aphelenchoides fujianensis]
MPRDGPLPKADLSPTDEEPKEWKEMSVAEKGEQVVSIFVKLILLAFQLIGGRGLVISVHEAIFLMIGSEMGSSLMNVLVSLGQSGDREQFRTGFCGGNACSKRLSALIVQPLSKTHTKEFQGLQLITKPLLSKIVQIDSKAITRVTFIFRCIDLDTHETLPFCPYEHLFAHSTLSDSTVGILLLLGSLVSLILCLVGIVKIIETLLKGQVAVFVKKTLDYDFPAPTLQIALCQTLYNVIGVLLFYPIPFMRKIPLTIAMKLGDTTAKVSFPHFLPPSLRTWDFLPLWMHSLAPHHEKMVKLCANLPCCPKRFFAPTEDEPPPHEPPLPPLLKQTPV